jgi:hypothetical protein
VDGPIYAMAVQPDGQIVIGGEFTSVNGIPRCHIARVFGSEQTPEPFILGPYVSAGGVEIRVPTVGKRAYHMEWKGDLSETEWKPLQSIIGDGSHATISDAAPDLRQRFYRVLAE